MYVCRCFTGIGRSFVNLPMPGSRVLRSSRIANYSKWRRESDRMERTGIHNPQIASQREQRQQEGQRGGGG